MRLLYAIESWALIVLGVLHMGATFRFFSALNPQALWFFSAGLLMALVGVLNLLNRRYGQNAPGLRHAARATNVVMIGFAAATGTVTRASVLEWVVVMGIVIPLAVLSFSPTVVQKNAG